MERLASCPVCKAAEDRPRRLGCGHSLGETCITELYHQQKLKASKDKKKFNHGVLCPICGEFTSLARGNPSEVALDYALELYWRTGGRRCDEVKVPCELCHKERTGAAERWCRECHAHMCQRCADRHGKVKLFADHTITSAPVATCPDHKAYFRFLCVTCNRLLCFVCVNEGFCDGHDISTLVNIDKEKRTQLHDIIEKLGEEINDRKQTVEPFINLNKRQLEQVHLTKESIQTHANLLTQQIRDKEKQLMDIAENRENALKEAAVYIAKQHQVALLEDMRDAALSAKDDAIEKIVMVTSAIKSKFPARCQVEKEAFSEDGIRFVPCQDVRVGDLAYSPPRLARPVWEISGISGGYDVAFTPCGSVAIVDIKDKKVALYDMAGGAIADTSQQNVQLVDPRGIACSYRQSALYVTDRAQNCILILDCHDLHLIRTVTLEGTPKPWGVTVLDNGNIVSTQAFEQDKVALHDPSGNLIKMISKYGDVNEHNVHRPYHLTNSNGKIFVAMATNKHIVQFSDDGTYEKILRIKQGNPSGLDVNVGQLCVVSRPNHVFRFDGQHSWDEQHTLLDISEADRSATGDVMSVTRFKSKMAVIFFTSLRMYHFS